MYASYAVNSTCAMHDFAWCEGGVVCRYRYIICIFYFMTIVKNRSQRFLQIVILQVHDLQKALRWVCFQLHCATSAIPFNPNPIHYSTKQIDPNKNLQHTLNLFNYRPSTFAHVNLTAHKLFLMNAQRKNKRNRPITDRHINTKLYWCRRDPWTWLICFGPKCKPILLWRFVLR